MSRTIRGGSSGVRGANLHGRDAYRPCCCSRPWALGELPPVPNLVRHSKADTEARVRGCLGDYRIIREVGRGGMGVVYEAEQISLSRRVALKVLPFAAMMDARHLQRFQNEARAAAGLNHTNIVPVYGVGCERGVHYYAMQFIDGRTLAEFIAQQNGASPSQVPTMDQTAARKAARVRRRPFLRRPRPQAAAPARCGLLPAGGGVGYPGGGGAAGLRHTRWAWSTATSSRRTC